MFAGRDREGLDSQHEDAIRAGLHHLPYMNEYRGYAIDNIHFIREDISGDRTYQVCVTAWDKEEARRHLIWEVQTGLIDGGVAAVYWVAK